MCQAHPALAPPYHSHRPTSHPARANLSAQAALRAATADFLWQHALEFQPFFTNDDGDPMTIGPSSAPCFPAAALYPPRTRLVPASYPPRTRLVPAPYPPRARLVPAPYPPRARLGTRLVPA